MSVAASRYATEASATTVDRQRLDHPQHTHPPGQYTRRLRFSIPLTNAFPHLSTGGRLTPVARAVC